MRHQVDADEVEQPEDAGLRHADRRAHGGVGFLHRQPHGEGMVDRGLHPLPADAVGDEAGPIMAVDHGLAEHPVSKGADFGRCLRARRRAAHDLQQPHVARRVEEMGDQEIWGQRRALALQQRRERDGRGVGGDDGARLADAGELRIERALGLGLFDDRLDDPVAIGQQRQAGCEIAGGDQPRRRAAHEGGGIGAQHALHRRRRAARDDIQQHHGQAGIGHLRGDAGAHHAGADDRDLGDGHQTASSTVAMPWPPPMHCVASA